MLALPHRHPAVAAFALLLAAAAATGTATRSVAAEPVQVTHDADLNYMPSLIERHDGSLMLAYERLDPGTLFGDLLVTFSEDGAAWTEPIVILATAANERHPALVQLQDGSYRVYYLSNAAGSYKICSAASEDGLAWFEQGVVELGWTTESLVNPTVCLEPDGSLTMTYDRLSFGGYIAHSEDGATWDPDRTQVSNGALNRILRHSDGTYVLSYQRRTGTQSSQIDIMTRTSPDRIAWSPENRVTYTMNSHDSFPVELEGGVYGLYYITSTGGQPYDLFARNSTNGTDWVDEQNLLPYAGWDTQPHPVRLGSGDIALAWSRGPTQLSMQVYFARFPSAADADGAPTTRRAPAIVALPNPSDGAVRLELAVRGRRCASLDILDLGGRRVRRVAVSADGRAGLWDGRDEAGRRVAAGVYYAVDPADVAARRTRLIQVR